MAKLVVKYSNYYKRAVFPKGKQKDFLKKMQVRLGLTSEKFANFAGIKVRSMSDWKREKFSMSLPALKKMCQRAKITLPKNIKIKNPFWYTSNGSFAGGIAVYKKYGCIGGDSKYRKKKWYEWWEKKGKFRKHPFINVCLPINIPKRSSELAEFVGIILGDGCISQRQISITLHKSDDWDFSMYVRNLMKQLFLVSPSLYERKRENVINIVISRSELVKFFHEMGLPTGSKVKHQTDIPLWIKKSDQFTKFCLKGLFDTDGCFYIDKHLYKGKAYYNSGMNFTNRSLPILSFFKESLKKFRFHPTQKTKFSVFLRKEEEIVKYFETIGTANKKHYKKFQEYFKNKYGGVPKWS